MSKLIGPLTYPTAHGLSDDVCFDVVIPSLPGFCFSNPMRAEGINFWRTADVWADLMTNLGYARFGAYGCDWGALITGQLAHKYGDRIIAAHGSAPPSLFNVERPGEGDRMGATPVESPRRTHRRTPDARRSAP